MNSLPPTGRLLAICLVCLPCCAAIQAADPVLRVAAASSLADALKQLNPAFTKASGAKVELNLGASNALVRQIVAGAPADVFFSADSAKMDELAVKGLIDQGTRKNYLSNSLVVVVSKDSALQFTNAKELAGPTISRIVTGDPKAVPVGVYAKQYFATLGIWEQLAPKIVAADNVRAALAAVELGNIEVGVVYKSDAAISKKIKVALEIPVGDVPAIVFPMAVLKDAAQPSLARRYLEFLVAPSSRLVFEEFGFIVLPEADGDR